MAFIGNTNTTQAFTPAVDYFSGNASTTAFTLSRPVASVAQVQAVVNNVAQNPSDAFTVSGSTITFTSAPSSGTNNIYVYYTSPITQVIAPGQGTVTTTSLTSSLTLTTPVISTITNTGTLTLPTVTGTLIGTGTVSMVVYTASTTISVPSGASIGLCQVWGAGGGSGGSGTAPGAGGGGGGFGQQYFTAAQLTGQTLTIGSAGTAGTSAPTAGGNGGTTSIGSLISATGGTGSAGANGGIAGGTGGTSSATFNVTGSAGGQNNYVAAGGTFASGHGGGCFGVSNAVGVNNVAGVEPGVGGNGNIVTSTAGAAGGKGRVVIFWS